MFRGIHAEAKDQWLQRLDANWQHFLSHPCPIEIRNELEIIASHIQGIGEITIDETLAYILEEQAKHKRGF